MLPARMMICNRSAGWRWPLRDNVEVEVFSDAHDLVATLHGGLVLQVLWNFLSMSALQASLRSLELTPGLTLAFPAEPVPEHPAFRAATKMQTLRTALRSRKGIKMPPRRRTA